MESTKRLFQEALLTKKNECGRRESMSEEPEILPASLADQSDEKIAQALVDAPVDTDLARCALASRIIYTDNNPARWAAVCNLARTMLQVQGLTDENRERDAALAIEEANGTRRKSAGTWDIAGVESLLAIARTQIQRLPEGERRSRLEELRLYHGGQAELLVGRFGRAADYYDFAARIATTPFSKALNSYLARYHRLDEALVRGDEHSIEMRYEVFWHGSESFVEVLNRSVETELRWYGNVICHRRRADWLCRQTGRMQDLGSLTELVNLPQSLQPAFRDATTLLFGIFLVHHQDGTPVEQSVANICAHCLIGDPSTEIEWRSLAYLLKAEIEDRYGDTEAALATLRTLTNLVGYGGHVARAVARRRLEHLS